MRFAEESLVADCCCGAPGGRIYIEDPFSRSTRVSFQPASAPGIQPEAVRLALLNPSLAFNLKQIQVSIPPNRGGRDQPIWSGHASYGSVDFDPARRRRKS